jgi:hypothetical protein
MPSTPPPSDAHAFDAVIQAGDHATAAYGELAGFVTLKSFAATQKAGVPNQHGVPSVGQHAGTDVDLLDPNATSDFHSRSSGLRQTVIKAGCPRR